MIVVDNIGKDENVIAKKLSNKGLKVERKNISNDYYIVGEDDKIMVERKTTKDYIYSLRNGNLFKQMKTCDLLIIEEGWSEVFKWKNNVNYKEICGSMASILAKWNIPILHFQTQNQLVEFLVRLEEQLGPSDSCDYYPKRQGKVKDEARPVFFMKGFEGIGDSTAVKILNHFNTIKNVVNAQKEDLMEIDGIGESKAEGIVELVEQKFDKD